MHSLIQEFKSSSPKCLSSVEVLPTKKENCSVVDALYSPTVCSTFTTCFFHIFQSRYVQLYVK